MVDGKGSIICRELYINLDKRGHTFSVSIFYFLLNFLKKFLAKKNINFSPNYYLDFLSSFSSISYPIYHSSVKRTPFAKN